MDVQLRLIKRFQAFQANTNQANTNQANPGTTKDEMIMNASVEWMDQCSWNEFHCFFWCGPGSFLPGQNNLLDQQGKFILPRYFPIWTEIHSGSSISLILCSKLVQVDPLPLLILVAFWLDCWLLICHRTFGPSSLQLARCCEVKTREIWGPLEGCMWREGGQWTLETAPKNTPETQAPLVHQGIFPRQCP